MEIKFDEFGICLADSDVKSYVQHVVNNKIDAHVSNMLIVHGIRAELHKLSIKDRPQVTWIFFGEEVHFDDDLKSADAWKDNRTDLISEFLFEIL